MSAKSLHATGLRAAKAAPLKARANKIEVLPAAALDDRIAIVGTAGSGKTYAAKGFVERLLGAGARVAVVDPLGVWWGVRASADGTAASYPVVVFGGRHADVAITAEMGAALGRLIAGQALGCVVDLSELDSSTARRRFMAAFAEALYETNDEPLHLVLDEADLWVPQRPIKGWEGLLRTLVAHGHYMEAGELAAALGKKPSGGHWNSGIAVLRNNGLIETEAVAGPAGASVTG